MYTSSATIILIKPGTSDMSVFTVEAQNVTDDELRELGALLPNWSYAVRMAGPDAELYSIWKRGEDMVPITAPEPDSTPV